MKNEDFAMLNIIIVYNTLGPYQCKVSCISVLWQVAVEHLRPSSYQAFFNN